MKNFVLVHGKPTEERYNNPELPKPHKANWLPWLGAKLEEDGVSVAIPAMPRPFFPDYELWKKELEKQTVDTDSGLAGHSAGTELILRWLSENDHVTVERVALVAPYRDEAGKYGNFSDYSLDSSLAERIGRLTIFSSRDDSDAIQRNAHRLAEAVPGTHLIELDGYGHFMIGNNMTGPEFPELYEELSR